MDIILDVMLNIKLNLNRELTRIDANRDWPEGRIGEWGAGIHLTIGDLSLRNPDSTCRLGRKARQRQSSQSGKTYRQQKIVAAALRPSGLKEIRCAFLIR